MSSIAGRTISQLRILESDFAMRVGSGSGKCSVLDTLKVVGEMKYRVSVAGSSMLYNSSLRTSQTSKAVFSRTTIGSMAN